MPNTREKLIDLMTAFYGVDPMYYGVEAQHLADHLIANGVTVQEWIPVTERLPETSCLCIASKYNVPFLAWYMGNGWRSASTISAVDGITHWMPLPEPPKGE